MPPLPRVAAPTVPRLPDVRGTAGGRRPVLRELRRGPRGAARAGAGTGTRTGGRSDDRARPTGPDDVTGHDAAAPDGDTDASEAVTDSFVLAPPLALVPDPPDAGRAGRARRRHAGAGRGAARPGGRPARGRRRPQPKRARRPAAPAEAADSGPVCVACGARRRRRGRLLRALRTRAAAPARPPGEGVGRAWRRSATAACGTTATRTPSPSPPPRCPTAPAAVAAVVCDGVSTAYPPRRRLGRRRDAAGSESLLAALERGAGRRGRRCAARCVAAFDAVTALADDGGRRRAPAPHQQRARLHLRQRGGDRRRLVTVGWVGDSRAYWVPDDRSRPSARLTEDDSWAAQDGRGRPDDARRRRTPTSARTPSPAGSARTRSRSTRTRPPSQPDGPGVIVVLHRRAVELRRVGRRTRRGRTAATPAPGRCAAARRWSAFALDGGGHDNITVAVLPFPADRVPGRTPPRAAGPSSSRTAASAVRQTGRGP